MKPIIYTQDLQIACNASGCRKWAVVEIWDRRKGPQGKYCRECGRRLVKKLTLQIEAETEPDLTHHA